MIRSSDNRRGGFTLLETLLTVAVLVILLGLSAVGVVRYRDPLKITELDNAARAIYMAAENRAVLLQNSGASVGLLGTKAPSADPVELSNRNSADIGKLASLLPAGVIDPALREGHFLVLYDAGTHHVTEVFYAEGTEDIPSGDDYLELFRKSRTQRIESYRRGDVPCLVGHYPEDGDGAADIGTRPLPTPGVEVRIKNGEELTLTVKYDRPKGLPDEVSFTPEVTLTCGGKTTELWDQRRTPKDSISFTAGDTAEYTWVLDSLESGKHFKDLFSEKNLPDALGGVFTVTAKLTLSAAGYLDSSYYAQATENSLFDTTSTDDTAYIANLRHLQNLDTVSSGAAQKKAAVQIKDIDCKDYKGNDGSTLIPNYEFIPIENWDVLSFKGAHTEGEGENETVAAQYFIRNLKVTAASASTPNTGGAPKNNAGLFYGVNYNFEFKYVYLANSSIEGAASGHVGGLAGSAPDTRFTKCSLEAVTVKSPDAWSWSYAGGLAGYWWGVITVDGCKAGRLTVTSSGAYAGGLAGSGPEAVFTDCTVEDAVITAKGTAGGGGLVGSEYGRGTYKNCHVVNARVSSGLAAGGLVGSTGYAEGEDHQNVSHPVQFTGCTVTGVTAEAVSYAGGLIGVSVTGDKFANCAAKDTKVTSSVEWSVSGGLAGKTEKKGATFEGCRVYWDDLSLVNGWNDHKIIGGTAGGLVGTMGGGGTITNSFAATLIDGKTYAGGLIGSLPAEDNTVTIKESYADCYLQAGNSGTAWSSAGGLIGVKEAGDVLLVLELENVYSAGFIEIAAGSAAGLCGGWNSEKTTIKNAYAAVHCTNAKPTYPLAADIWPNNSTNVYFLEPTDHWLATDYDAMRAISLSGAFETKSGDSSHSYSLDGKTRGAYPFPGLAGLDHYGDWKLP